MCRDTGGEPFGRQQSPTPAYDGSACAATILKAVVVSSDVKTTDDACKVGLGWVCAIDTIESPSPQTIKVTLKPEQVWVSMADTTDWYKWGEHVARGIWNFVDSSGDWVGSCWQPIAEPPNQIDVYESTGELAFLSPPGFPQPRPRHPSGDC